MHRNHTFQPQAELMGGMGGMYCVGDLSIDLRQVVLKFHLQS